MTDATGAKGDVTPTCSVAEFLAHVDVAASFELVDPTTDTKRPLTHPRIQKSGLVLVGHEVGLVPTRVQVLGETEISYLRTLSHDERVARLEWLFAQRLSLVVVTRGLELLDELHAVATRTRTPLARTTLRSSRAIQLAHGALDLLLAPTTRLHGVLLDVHGIGMLLRGPSGIGKSECALFLVERGHRLVADDQVDVMRVSSRELSGSAPSLLRNHLELRGIGIVNVRDLYGAAAVRERKLVQLCVELCRWDDEPDDYERLGLHQRMVTILDVAIPLLRIPVRPGRDMGVILEVAARNHLLQTTGHHAAREFVSKLEASLGVGGTEPEETDR